MMRNYLILFGSNMEPEQNMEGALRRLRELDEVRILRVSQVYESDTVLSTGEVDSSRPKFLNAAFLIQAPLMLDDLRAAMRQIESEMGRVRVDDKYADRPVDLDIIGTKTQDGTVELEDSVHDHVFAALPAADVAPDWPVASRNGETIADIAKGFIAEEIQIRRIW